MLKVIWKQPEGARSCSCHSRHWPTAQLGRLNANVSRLLSYACTMLALVAPVPALADGLVTGKIIKLNYDPTAVFILTDGTKTGNPGCSVTTSQFAVPLSNTTAIAFLLSARSNGTTVTVGGSGACTTVSGTENFQWVGY